MTNVAPVAHVARKRWRVGIALTAAMVLVYFGFVALVAYGKAWMGTLLVPGLSMGIVLGALTILTAIALTGVYVWWANTRYDAALEKARTSMETTT
jgi:uncharacterized membrane protein (DUF485 family)